MKMEQGDFLKKALLDTQERVRDYMNYSKQVDEPQIQNCFREFAKTEGKHAQELQKYIEDFC